MQLDLYSQTRYYTILTENIAKFPWQIWEVAHVEENTSFFTTADVADWRLWLTDSLINTTDFSKKWSTTTHTL